MGVCDRHGSRQAVQEKEVVGRYTPMPEDQYHLNIIWILLRIYWRLLVSGTCFLIGAVLGILLQVYWGIPYWIPVPLLILALLGKRYYSSVFLVGLVFPLLGQLFH